VLTLKKIEMIYNWKWREYKRLMEAGSEHIGGEQFTCTLYVETVGSLEEVYWLLTVSAGLDFP